MGVGRFSWPREWVKMVRPDAIQTDGACTGTLLKRCNIHITSIAIFRMGSFSILPYKTDSVFLSIFS